MGSLWQGAGNGSLIAPDDKRLGAKHAEYYFLTSKSIRKDCSSVNPRASTLVLVIG